MKITVITICYNNEQDIEPTLLSVINQDYVDLEYIVIDGGSKDKTLEFIEKYKRKIDVLISEPDEGMYDAINKGIKRATGEVIGLIHAGDRLYENSTISKIAKHFDEFPEIDGMYGNSKTVTLEGKLRRVNIGGEFSKAKIKNGWMPSHQSIYLRKEVFGKYGLYRNDLGGAGDYELFIRFFYCQNLNIRYLNEFIIYFTLGGRSTRSIWVKLKSQRTHLKCWELNGLRPPVFLPFKKILRGFIKRVYGLLKH
jgi:glycosyltransferase involved in cell wall biosynthesis